MSKTRIYKVTTPTGIRLVESPTKGQAVKHCVDADYHAEVVGAAEAFDLRDKGTELERVASKNAPAAKVAPKKAGTSTDGKSSTESDANSQTASSPAPTPTTVPSQQSSPATPPAAVPATQSAPAEQSPSPQAEVKAGSFIPPQAASPTPAPGVNPVIAEQQAINPNAAAAAGAPAEGGPVDWEAREKAAG